MVQTVIGLFDTAAQAHQAVQSLVNSGFNSDQIDLSVQIIAGNTGSSTGLSDGEAYSDSIGNFFGSLFGSSDQASIYGQVARRSGSIVTVHAQSAQEAEKAARLLDEGGALDIDEHAARYGYASGESSTPDSGSPIPVIKETLHEGKQAVKTSEARQRSRIVERSVEENVRLRSEHRPVGGIAVDQPTNQVDSAAFRKGDPDMSAQADSDPASSRTVTHLFRDWDSLENAYQYVRKSGYDKEEVNVVMTDKTREQQFSDHNDSVLKEKTLEGLGTGSAIGGTLGAIAGAIAAIGTSIALPGLGLVVAGPIAAGLAGAGAGGLTGGLLGALAKSGLSEDQAKHYQSGIEQGGVLLSLEAHSPEDARRIEQEWQTLDKGAQSS